MTKHLSDLQLQSSKLCWCHATAPCESQQYGRRKNRSRQPALDFVCVSQIPPSSSQSSRHGWKEGMRLHPKKKLDKIWFDVLFKYLQVTKHMPLTWNLKMPYSQSDEIRLAVPEAAPNLICPAGFKTLQTAQSQDETSEGDLQKSVCTLTSPSTLSPGLSDFVSWTEAQWAGGQKKPDLVPEQTKASQCVSLSLSPSLAAQCNSTTSPCLSLSQLNASQSKLSALICCSSENTLCPADIILTAVMWCDTPLLEWKLLWQESYKYETPCSNTLLHNRSQWHTISSLTLENNIYRYHIQYIMY